MHITKLIHITKLMYILSFLVLIYLNVCIKIDESDVVLALKRCNDTTEYTIHGLWNETSDFCGNDTFEYDKIKSLVSELDRYWYSCYTKNYNNEDFWKHEYEKHGTCFKQFSQYDYFFNTLKIFNSLNISQKCDYTKYDCIIRL